MEPLLFAAVTTLVDILPTTFMGWMSAAVLGCCGWLVKQTYSNDKRITSHEATDQVRFDHIKGTLESLKEGRCVDSAKLDRLIEHLMFGSQFPREMPKPQSHLVAALRVSPPESLG